MVVRQILDLNVEVRALVGQHTTPVIIITGVFYALGNRIATLKECGFENTGNKWQNTGMSNALLIYTFLLYMYIIRIYTTYNYERVYAIVRDCYM